MREFIDLHLRPREDEAPEMLQRAVELGYSGAALVGDHQIPLQDELDLDIVSRIDLVPKNTRELSDALRRTRRRFEIVAVECRNKKVARQAAKDHRVDILNFTMPPSKNSAWFDRQEATLASGNRCALEFNVSNLVQLGPLPLARTLSRMRVELENARSHGVPVVVSSGAESPLQMREPRGLASVLGLLGDNEELGLETISTNPWDMVDSNRKKLDPGYVNPGVREV